MQTPIQYPFTDYATWIAGVGPSISADFLSKTQRGMAELYGALIGRAATIERDEFDTRSFPAGRLGSMQVLTNTNPPGTMQVGPYTLTNVGEQGVVQVLANAAAAFTFDAQGADNHLGLFDWLFSVKLRSIDLSRLDTVANKGLQVGLMDQVEASGTSCRFLLGNDSPNWQVLIGATLIDTGVAFTNTFHDLQMARLSGAVTAYIDGALVATVAHNVAMPRARRRVGATSPGANIGDGMCLDYFRAWYAR